MQIPFVFVSIFKELYYKHFSLVLQGRNLVSFEYNLTSENFKEPVKRPRRFFLDPNLPSEFQQYTASSYHQIQPGWDRGHMVASGHMKQDALSRRETHYMTNIVPQTGVLNRGLWLETEYYALNNMPCHIRGDLIYNDTANDYFVNSHGVKTPDFFHKTVTCQNQSISWIFPNSFHLSHHLQDYVVIHDTI